VGRDVSVPGHVLLEIDGCLAVTQEPEVSRAFEIAANTLSPREVIPEPNDTGARGQMRIVLNNT